MKKILFVATVVRLHINMFHKPFLKWFKEQGWQVDVAANNDYKDKSDCIIPNCDNFYCIPFERSPFSLRNIAAYRELKKLIDSEYYDIIHCHTPVGSVIARLAAIAARKNGTKVIYTAHGFHFFKGAPLLYKLLFYPVERLLARKTDILLTINAEDAKSAEKFRAGKTYGINGVGIDTQRFRPISPAEKQAVREQLGLKDEDVFALCVARLEIRKSHDTLIKAVSQLEDPHFHLFFCGDGHMEEPLKELAKSLNLENQVHFVGFRPDVNKLCGAADLFLLASLQEGLPVSVMEAMACALPVIGSDVRGLRDLIDSGKGGVLVPPTDVNGFAAAIKDTMAHKERLPAMGAYNLKKSADYSIEVVLRQMTDIYKTVM